MINIYDWKKTSPKDKERLLNRSETDISEQLGIAEEILAEVKEKGDKAVVKYTEKFDGVKISPEKMRVGRQEIERAYQNIDADFKRSLQMAYENVKKYHQEQMPKPLWFTETRKGVLVGEKTDAIDNVCLYVPRGKGSFPSVLLMLAIPAQVAGVKRIVVTSPPAEDGNLDEAVLATAKICGIDEIYKVGGIQAVGAISYGTETIPKCLKIIGPGNSFVTAAKRLVSSFVDIGSPAGPSEGLILSDGSVDYRKVCLDLMIEAEHGPDSAALLVTPDPELAEKIGQQIKIQLAKLSPKRQDFIKKVFKNYGGIILTDTMEEAIDFVNDYAPEHMEILCKNPWDIFAKIRNAGEILIGENSPISLANFVLGPNAILPTGKKAKTYSSVSVRDFLKSSSVCYVSEEGLENVGQEAIAFARAEGFETHRLAIEERDNFKN